MARMIHVPPRLAWVLVICAALIALMLLTGCTTLDEPVKRELVHVGDVAQEFDDSAYEGVANAARSARDALRVKGRQSAEVGLGSRMMAHQMTETLTAKSGIEAAKEYAQALLDLEAQVAKIDQAIGAGDLKRGEARRIRTAADEVLKRSESFTWDDLADILGGLQKEIP